RRRGGGGERTRGRSRARASFRRPPPRRGRSGRRRPRARRGRARRGAPMSLEGGRPYSGKGAWALVAKIGLSVGLMVFLFARIPFHEVLASIRGARREWLFAALGL